jgi:hypothetical protein
MGVQISEKGAMVRPFPFEIVYQKNVPIAKPLFATALTPPPFFGTLW